MIAQRVGVEAVPPWGTFKYSTATGQLSGAEERYTISVKGTGADERSNQRDGV